MYCRLKPEETEQSFITHIWMIHKLLPRKNPRLFSLYIIAACYPKVLRRLEFCTSQSYLTSLKKIQTFIFSEQSYEAMDSKKECDLDFLSHLEEIEPLLEINIPKLMDKNSGRQHNIYTEETCTEFHQLLCVLLEKFFKCLKDLKVLQKDPKRIAKDIVNQLDLIARIGITLRSMVRGAAIKKHLQVIDKFLPDRTDLVQQGGRDGEEEDPDFPNKPLWQPGKPLLKWKTCGNWLELLVAHFDAIQVLARFVKSHESNSNFNLDIKVLSQDGPDARMLPWKELLASEKYFPERPGPSAQDLINFLDPEPKLTDPPIPPKSKPHNKDKQETATAELVIGSLMALGFPNDGDAIDGIIDKMRRLTNCTSPGSGVYTNTIVWELESLKTRWPLYTQDDTINHITNIVAMIRTLRDNAKLYASLKKGKALHSGKGFTGTYHCETNLGTCKIGASTRDRFVSLLF